MAQEKQLPPSPATALDAHAQCELREIIRVARKFDPKVTKQVVLAAAVEETNALSFQEAVDGIFNGMVAYGTIKRTPCAGR